jgi:hypothetical protein
MVLPTAFFAATAGFAQQATAPQVASNHPPARPTATQTTASTTTHPASGATTTAPTARSSANTTKHIFNSEGVDCTAQRELYVSYPFKTQAEVNGFNTKCNVPGIEPIN